ncbi:hypothetical protein D9757_002358 [Collybiopsis confluens]|uniref:F-box domain-containing protein n=1 Tax=Collybiopsis confluens TaxID=2823264 RepID=A0A8H5HYA3_9AGAR|nr:hypothetical protein D9757_002358 [Collybiopsis confluens]
MSKESLLLGLPDDVLFHIVAHMNVEEVISFHQTCRVLHALIGSTDYIWHNILTIDLPLNLPHGARIHSLSGSELRQLSVQALRVDHGWRKNPASLKALNRIQHRGIVGEMKYLPPRWLVTMSRVSESLGCALSIWDCDDPNKAEKVQQVSLNTPNQPMISVALAEDGLHALVVMYGRLPRPEILRVYFIPMQRGLPSVDNHTYLISRITTDEVPGSVFDTHICGKTISCLIARFSNNLATYHILFLDTQTGKYRTVDFDVPQSALRVRLFPDSFLALAGFENNKSLHLRLYNVASLLQSLRESPEIRPSPAATSLGEPYAEFSSSTDPPLLLLGRGREYELSNNCNSNTIAAIDFCGGMIDYFLRFPVYSNEMGLTRYQDQEEVPTYPFNRPRGAFATPGVVSFGDTGRRAVWIERRLDFDDAPTWALVKGTFPSHRSGPVHVGLLLPDHMALPFKLEACLSTALDEARGRVYLGLYTGEVYILDF